MAKLSGVMKSYQQGKPMSEKPKLTVSLTEAENTISHWLNTGDDFYSSPMSEPQLSRAIERFDEWCTDVKEELIELFTTPEVAERFAAAESYRGNFEGIDEEGRRYFKFAGTLEAKMEWLKRLKQNLSTHEVINEGKVTDLWGLIHPSIVTMSKSRFDSGHYADAVETALKHINTIVKAKVKKKTGNELDGSTLMNTAFSPKSPIISLDDLSTDSGKNAQLGYMQIFAGAMTGIRNPKAHEVINIDQNRAMHLLFLASLLMYKLDEAI